MDNDEYYVVPAPTLPYRIRHQSERQLREPRCLPLPRLRQLQRRGGTLHPGRRLEGRYRLVLLQQRGLDERLPHDATDEPGKPGSPGPMDATQSPAIQREEYPHLERHQERVQQLDRAEPSFSDSPLGGPVDFQPERLLDAWDEGGGVLLRD